MGIEPRTWNLPRLYSYGFLDNQRWQAHTIGFGRSWRLGRRYPTLDFDQCPKIHILIEQFDERWCELAIRLGCCFLPPAKIVQTRICLFNSQSLHRGDEIRIVIGNAWIRIEYNILETEPVKMLRFVNRRSSQE
jgi:hypothetical protein